MPKSLLEKMEEASRQPMPYEGLASLYKTRDDDAKGHRPSNLSYLEFFDSLVSTEATKRP